MQQSGSPTNLLCCTCSHWQRDDVAMRRLGLNFSVGKCYVGRSTSHGLTRGHDYCEEYNRRLQVNDCDGPAAENTSADGSSAIAFPTQSLGRISSDLSELEKALEDPSARILMF